MLELYISLALTAFITIAVHLYFRESGLNAFPLLTILVVMVLSYAASGYIAPVIANALRWVF